MTQSAGGGGGGGGGLGNQESHSHSHKCAISSPLMRVLGLDRFTKGKAVSGMRRAGKDQNPFDLGFVKVRHFRVTSANLRTVRTFGWIGQSTTPRSLICLLKGGMSIDVRSRWVKGISLYRVQHKMHVAAKQPA